MDTYEMTCTCGHVLKVDASTPDEAIGKMKEMMDEAAINEHWEEMHAGEPVPRVQDVHRMIETELVPVEVTG